MEWKSSGHPNTVFPLIEERIAAHVHCKWVNQLHVEDIPKIMGDCAVYTIAQRGDWSITDTSNYILLPARQC